MAPEGGPKTPCAAAANPYMVPTCSLSTCRPRAEVATEVTAAASYAGPQRAPPPPPHLADS
eukprot:scaffold893_cov336-Prasinococcus_capsulatus_cf.AAC.5